MATFELSVFTDEITHDFGRAVEVAAKDLGLGNDDGDPPTPTQLVLAVAAWFRYLRGHCSNSGGCA